VSDHLFDSTQALDSALAIAIAARLSAAIERAGEAWLVVSGGRTPLGLFAALAAQPLDWSRVVVTLADERWVDSDHPDSNARLVCEHLLVGAASAAMWLPLAMTEQSLEDAVSELDDRLMRAPRFAAVVLGMGEDGHTASLFPLSDQLDSGLSMNSGRSCIAADPVTAPHWRVSMTLPRLLDCDEIFLHIVGPNKRRVLAAARAGDDLREMPVRALLRQSSAPLSVYWSDS